MATIIREKQDLTYLKWAHARTSSGTAGTFLKSESRVSESGRKVYYKLSNFDREAGVVGHECINEIIVDRLLSILGVEHLDYTLIHADINHEGKIYETWLCASEDFKGKGESKAALDDYFYTQKNEEESPYEFCCRMGWKSAIEQMLVIDYLILNRDRHGANIEVLRNRREKTIRIAPFFDHGVSLMYSCMSEEAIRGFDVLEDKPCQNFIGSKSTLNNLKLVENPGNIFAGKLGLGDKDILFEDLEGAISKEHMDKLWDMIWKRWCYYENLCNL